MGDDVQLAAARARHDILDPLSQLFRTVLHRKRALLIAVIDLRAVFLESRRDTSPIIQKTAVAEEYSAHEQYRVLCRAYALVVTVAVKLYAGSFGYRLSVRFNVDYHQHNKICGKDHSEDQPQNAMLHTKLHRRNIHADYAVPEDNKFAHHQNDYAADMEHKAAVP